jgi:hypothetical protein
LMKNNSITELNLSLSNFQGPFEFLKKKTLKKFIFKGIWENIAQKNSTMTSFIEYLKSNTSLTEMNLSVSKSNTNEVNGINTVIEILSKHENIEKLAMHSFYHLTKAPDFGKLLKNPKLKKLETLSSSEKSLEMIFKGLNVNENLMLLSVSGYYDLDYSVQWESLKLTNKSLQKFCMHGKSFISLNFRK